MALTTLPNPLPVSLTSVVDATTYTGVYTSTGLTSGSAVEMYNVTGSQTVTLRQFVLNCSDNDIFKVEFQTEEGAGDTTWYSFYCTNSVSISLSASKNFPTSADDALLIVTRIGAGSAAIKVAVVFSVA